MTSTPIAPTAASPATPSYEKRVRGVAKQFVAQSFYMPLLRELRENPLQSETSKMLSGGRGGEAFGAMLDEYRAKHMAGSTDGPLVDAIADRLLKAPASQAGRAALGSFERTA